MKKHTKKELRDAASSAIHGLLARLDMPIKGKTKELAKDVSKMLAKEIAEEYKKQQKKLRKLKKPPEL
ncbi:MAG TPA: hypothetical protein VFE50_01945 [Cyclobacteriaceae bacterium]|nr:hypothetical protein [Cyclobacteriaceae bacterium]